MDKPTRKLPQSRFGLAEQRRNLWRIEAEPGVEREHLHDAAFWSHVAAKLRAGDIIEVIADDGSFFSRLLVLSAGHLYANVYEMEYHDIAGVEMPAVGAEYAIVTQWRSMHHKHCVLRVWPDGRKDVLDTGFDDKAAAERKAGEYRKQIVQKAA